MIIIRTDVSPEGKALIGKLAILPDELTEAIKRGMDSAGQASLNEIRGARFTGKGPFPVEQHRLGQITGRLYGSLRWERSRAIKALPTVDVTGAMTSDVPYFRVHELGYSGSVKTKAFSRRPSGKGGKPRARRSVNVSAGTRSLNIPARAPMQTGTREHLDEFTTAIGVQLRTLWEAT